MAQANWQASALESARSSADLNGCGPLPSLMLVLRYLPLDYLLYITRQYINADVSRSGLARLVAREGMARLEGVIPTAEGVAIKPRRPSTTTSRALFAVMLTGMHMIVQTEHVGLVPCCPVKSCSDYACWGLN